MSVMPRSNAYQVKKPQKERQQNWNNTQQHMIYETEVLIKWISLKIDERTRHIDITLAVYSTAFSYIYVPSLLSTISRTKVITKRFKSQPVSASLPMKSLKSHKQCSLVEISNLNNK